MSEVGNVIEKQIDLMKIDLEIVLQKTKIAEYRARAKVLHARVGLEEFKLRGMEDVRKETEKPKSKSND